MINCAEGLKEFKRKYCDQCHANSKKYCQIRFLIERGIEYMGVMK